MTGSRFAAILAVLCLMKAHPAFAHGLLMKLRGEGSTLHGELYYSNGKVAGGEWVEILDLTETNEPITMQTSPKGEFTAAGMPGHQYRVTATAEEGHEIVMELVLEAQAKGKMVEAGADPQADEAEDGGIPAWALIGGLLVLSIVPALWWQRRK